MFSWSRIASTCGTYAKGPVRPVRNPADAGARVSIARALWTVVVCWGSLFFFLWPGEWFFPAGAVSVCSFALVPLFCSRCRFSRSPLITPLNWLLLGFFTQLVIMPITVRIWGPLHAFLPRQPSMLAINVATLIMVVAYWSFATAFHYGTRPAKVDGWRRKLTGFWPIPNRLIVAFALAGLGGLVARYKTVGAFRDFLTSPATYTAEAARNGASATVFDALSEFLSPMLGLAVVMLWCNLMERNIRQQRTSRFSGPFLVLVVAMTYSVLGYNRANFVFPLLAIGAVIARRVPGQTYRYLFLIGGALSVLLLVSVVYRFSAHPEDVKTGPSVDVLQTVDTSELFALYAQAPQYMAALLEGGDYGSQPRWGVLSLSALASNIPVVGKLVRPFNGYTFYALLTSHPEENPAFAGEVYLDFNLLGVVAVYAAIGLFTAWLQARVLLAEHAFEAFAFQLASVYLIACTLLSVEVLGQFAVYNMFPLHVYFIYRAAARRLTSRQAYAESGSIYGR